MNDKADILISLKPKHASNVFAGKKTVELRKRRPNVEPGTKIWIYATAPIAALKGYARLEHIVTATPKEIWASYGSETGISEDEFYSYFSNSEFAHALVLSTATALKHPILLKQMREMVSGFQPPQFFCRLNGAASEMRLHSRKFIPLRVA